MSSSLSLLDVTEMLYKAKVFMVILSFFNIVVSLFSIYALSVSGLLLFALISSIVFVFNTVLFYISIRNWNKNRVVEVKV